MRNFRPLLLMGLLLCTTNCTKPGQTTGVGAAAGGVVGAGLGAIIGSQAGSPGAGLAIGTAAGVATGALVGNALQAQEETNRTQDEAIERQQQMIAARGRELAEYSRSRDGAAPSGTVSRTAPNGTAMGYSYPGSTMRLSPAERQRLMRGERPEHESARGRYGGDTLARRSDGAISRSSASRSTASSSTVSHGIASRGAEAPARPEPRMAARSVPAPEKAPVERAVTAPTSIDVDPTETKTTASGLTERNLAVPEKPEVHTEDTAPAARVSDKAHATEGIPALPTGHEAAAVAEEKSGAVAKVRQAAAPASEECQRAEQEVSKAGASKEVADQLFHYRRALRLCPGNAEYHLGLGNVYKALNRTGDAEFEYREALRINPALSVARESLESLRF